MAETSQYDQDRILAYVEGEMPEDQRRRFEAELSGNPALRELIEAMASDRAELRSLEHEPAPQGLVEDAMQALERRLLLGEPERAVVEPTPAREVRKLRLFKWTGYGAIAALLMLSTAFIAYTLLDPTSPNGAVPFAMEDEPRGPRERSLAMDDASPPRASARSRERQRQPETLADAPAEVPAAKPTASLADRAEESATTPSADRSAPGEVAALREAQRPTDDADALADVPTLSGDLSDAPRGEAALARRPNAVAEAPIEDELTESASDALGRATALAAAPMPRRDAGVSVPSAVKPQPSGTADAQARTATATMTVRSNDPSRTVEAIRAWAARRGVAVEAEADSDAEAEDATPVLIAAVSPSEANDLLTELRGLPVERAVWIEAPPSEAATLVERPADLVSPSPTMAGGTRAARSLTAGDAAAASRTVPSAEPSERPDLPAMMLGSELVTVERAPRRDPVERSPDDAREAGVPTAGRSTAGETGSSPLPSALLPHVPLVETVPWSPSDSPPMRVRIVVEPTEPAPHQPPPSPADGPPEDASEDASDLP